jgi:outer membrane protein TolC
MQIAVHALKLCKRYRHWFGRRIGQWCGALALSSVWTIAAVMVSTVGPPQLAYAADGGAQVMTLAALIDELKQTNPQLEQAHQAYVAAQFQVPQAGSLPAPQLTLTEQANTGGSFDFKPENGFFAYPTFTQPFLWPGKRGLAAAVASAQAEIVGRQYDTLLIQLTAQLKLSVFQLLTLQEQLRFMGEDQQRLAQIKSLAQVRYANNAAAFVEFLNAQVAASSLDNDRLALERQIQTTKEQINTLVGRPARTDLQVQDPEGHPQLPAQSLDALLDLARRTNPALSASQSQVEAADKGLALAQKAFRPDFSLSAGTYTDPWLNHVFSSTRMYSVGVTMTLPTWGFAKEHAGVGQARAALAQAKAGQDAERQQLELGVANAYHELQTALQQMQFAKDRLLPQAQMAYRLALSAYSSNGSTAFSDLLVAQGGLRSTELASLQAQNAALQAYVSLVAAIGREPE